MSSALIRLGARPVDERVNVERALAAFNRFIFLKRMGAPTVETLPAARETVHYLQIARRYLSGRELMLAYTGPHRLIWVNFVTRATMRTWGDLGAASGAERKNIAQALALFPQWKSLPRGSTERKTLARQIVSNLRVAINQDKVQIDEIVRAWTNGTPPKAWLGFAKRAQQRSQKQQSRGRYAGFDLGGPPPTAKRKNVAQALQLFTQWKSLPKGSAEKKSVARQIVSNLRVAVNQERISYGDIVKAWPLAHPSGQPPKAWVGFARKATTRSIRQRFTPMAGIGIYDNAQLPVMAGSDLSLDGLGDLGTAGARLRVAGEMKARIAGLERDITVFRKLLGQEGISSEEKEDLRDKIKYREERIAALRKGLKEKTERKQKRARSWAEFKAAINPYGDAGEIGALDDLSSSTKRGLMLLGGLFLAGMLYKRSQKSKEAPVRANCNCDSV